MLNKNFTEMNQSCSVYPSKCKSNFVNRTTMRERLEEEEEDRMEVWKPEEDDASLDYDTDDYILGQSSSLSGCPD
jgi:hypothetical protein